MPEDQAFSELLDASMTELQMKTAAHQGAWGFGSFDRWDMDMEQGDLVFSTRKGMKAVCPCQIIGTHDSASGTWMWAWANASIPDALTIDSLKVKEYGEAHQIERLTTDKYAAEEMEGWLMTALAVKLCESQGAYRGPAGTTAVFMSFSNVQLSKAEPAPRKRWWPWSK